MHSDYQHQTKCFISQTSGPCPGFNIDSSFHHNLGEIRGNGVAGKVAKRTFRKVHEFWSKWFGRVFGHFEGNFLVLSKMPEDLTIELPL